MESRLLSIILPTYNSAKTISRCLIGLLNQTFQNFEVIILDGCSSDETIPIAKGYAYKFKNLRIESEKDKGIYDAMNKGIDKANGEWLYFLGSDDYLMTDTVLEQLINQVNLDEYDFVYGNVSSPQYGEKYDGQFDTSKILSQNICHQALFVRKELFDRFGKYNIRYCMLADYDFNLRCMFDKKVRKKYVDLTIAFYAPAGSSSKVTDELFIKDKNYLLLKYGFASFSWRQRFQLGKQLLRQKMGIAEK